MLKQGPRAAAVPKARAQKPKGTGSSAQVVAVLKEGMQGAAVPHARAHQPGGTDSPA